MDYPSGGECISDFWSRKARRSNRQRRTSVWKRPARLGEACAGAHSEPLRLAEPKFPSSLAGGCGSPHSAGGQGARGCAGAAKGNRRPTNPAPAMRRFVVGFPRAASVCPHPQHQLL